MEIKDFVKNFRNHPVVFIGTGLSMRYLETSYSWDALLKKIAIDFKENEEYFLDLKSQFKAENGYEYEKIATQIETDFNKYLMENRTGKFEHINDLFYENMKKDISISRFKLYIADLLNNTIIKKECEDEVSELIKARKNIGSIITTNYDTMIENIFAFTPLIGNDILLSNPYGSVYKIHGCVTHPDKIIITAEDYNKFNQKYELIRAQLLSLFMHNPIIFIGYSISDKNIKDILRTIFTYVDYSSDMSKKIRDNFLLVEYDKDSENTDVIEHDIDLEGFNTIRINRLRTDNYIALYRAIAELSLPVSVMDIRKVQSVVKEIYTGGTIKVSITEDLESLKNSDKVLVLGSKNTISYEYRTISEMISDYFQIIEESNEQLLKLIDKQKIQTSQYFPIFAFSQICSNINKADELKKQQMEKIEMVISDAPEACKTAHCSIKDIMDDVNISATNKYIAITYAIMKNNLDLIEVEKYLKDYTDTKDTKYRKILCAYDIKNMVNKLIIK